MPAVVILLPQSFWMADLLGRIVGCEGDPRVRPVSC